MINRTTVALVSRLASMVAFALPLAAAAQGCVAAADDGTRSEATAGPMGVTRKTTSSDGDGSDGTVDSAAGKGTTASKKMLKYYGGKVIPNVEVIAVNWSSKVPTTLSSRIGGFYTAVTNSAYFDMLSEYSTVGLKGTDGKAGSNQSIGRGTFYGSVTITPKNTKTALTDADIQTELKGQIASGALPPPNANRIYMIDFPHGTTIDQGGSMSCVDFCAYHGTTTISGQSVPYGVMPDMSAGSGCESGCGGNADGFNNATSVHSHELVEAVTDMEVGIGTTVGRPLAWYNTTSGEIGDICNAQQATMAGYTVQKEWSNSQAKCAASAP